MIYCIEDDKNIQDLIIYTLNNNGFEAKGFDSGEHLIENLSKEDVDLILLDIMLPGKDGIELLKILRNDKNFNQIPVIMLTSKSSELDKIIGLDSGADDYITKPFSILELQSRIKSVLRRTSKKVEDNILKLNGLEVDITKREVKLNDKEILNLTYKEFELLVYLLKNKDIVLTRENIISDVWGYDFEGETRTIDVHIATLRNKLKNWSNNIQTIRNLGYKIGDHT